MNTRESNESIDFIYRLKTAFETAGIKFLNNFNRERKPVICDEEHTVELRFFFGNGSYCNFAYLVKEEKFRLRIFIFEEQKFNEVVDRSPNELGNLMVSKLREQKKYVLNFA